jgi:molybdenum cofactor biosynthesis protein B
MSAEREFRPLGICVLSISDTRTLETDKSGDLLVGRLEAAGHHLVMREIVRDEVSAIRATVSAWIHDERVNAVLTTGGTGVTGRDGTPEALEPLFEKRIDGFGEIFRMISFEEIGTSSLQSRCTAGVANGCYIFALPGSSNACATGWDRIIAAQLDYRTRPCNLVELMPRLRE